MRPILIASLVLALPAAASAQTAPPLQPYAPPTSSAPLPPLGSDPNALPADPPLGAVRASSDTASNNSAADTRSPIAPRLPEPNATTDTPEGLLMAARAAIQSGQTGAAQEALERAESRLLSRDVAPSEADTAIESTRISAIGAARQALSVGNSAAAIQSIDTALRG